MTVIFDVVCDTCGTYAIAGPFSSKKWITHGHQHFCSQRCYFAAQMGVQDGQYEFLAKQNMPPTGYFKDEKDPATSRWR